MFSCSKEITIELSSTGKSSNKCKDKYKHHDLKGLNKVYINLYTSTTLRFV